MHTDELRAELAELAREVDAFPEDLAAVRRRVARRRVASGSIAVVLVVGLVAGGIALTRPGSNHVNVAGHPKSTSIATLPRVDALVGVPAHATAADITNVEQILDSTEAVEAYATIPRRFFTTATGGALFYPELRALKQSPVVFGVELSRSTPDSQLLLKTAIGSAATVQDFDAASGKQRARVDVEIFMEVHATSPEIDLVSNALHQDPDVVSFKFFTKQDAYNEFKQLFTDEPVLVENTNPSALPTSFRIVVRDGVMPSTVAARYRGVPGVHAADAAANPFAP